MAKRASTIRRKRAELERASQEPERGSRLFRKPESEPEREARLRLRELERKALRRASRTHKVTICFLSDTWREALSPERVKARMYRAGEPEPYEYDITGSSRADYERALYLRITPKTYRFMIGERGKPENTWIDMREPNRTNLDYRLGLRASSPCKLSEDYQESHSEIMLMGTRKGSRKPVSKPRVSARSIVLPSQYELRQAGIEFDYRIAGAESERISIDIPERDSSSELMRESEQASRRILESMSDTLASEYSAYDSLSESLSAFYSLRTYHKPRKPSEPLSHELALYIEALFDNWRAYKRAERLARYSYEPLFAPAF